MTKVAHIILLDQLTRNVYRGDKKTYQGDSIALALTKSLIASGEDSSLPPFYRTFVYMTLMHSEAVEDQKLCIEKFTKLNEETNSHKANIDYGIKHLEVIEKFGRFPHRNAMLGRESTPAELEYLAQPGAGF